MAISLDFGKQLRGYGLTTANILYRLPDHPAILQSFIWQNYDLAPDFPELERFLKFWRDSLDGALHSIEVAHKRLIGPAEWKKVDASFVLN